LDLSEKAPFEADKFYGLSLDKYKQELERIKMTAIYDLSKRRSLSFY